jgi:hypothetical protein
VFVPIFYKDKKTKINSELIQYHKALEIIDNLKKNKGGTSD